MKPVEPMRKAVEAWRAVPKKTQRSVISYFTDEAEQSDNWAAEEVINGDSGAYWRAEAKALRAAMRLLKAAAKPAKRGAR